MRSAAEIDQVSRYLQAHTRPEDPIFVVPWAAGFYFLADRPNPTRFDVLLYGDPDVYPCLISTLDERKPAYVVYGYAWDVDGKRFSEYAQPIDDYIRTRYQIAERFDEYEIWRRLDNAPSRCITTTPTPAAAASSTYANCGGCGDSYGGAESRDLVRW